MGPGIKYTDNLILKVENEDNARKVLELYQRNRTAFERFEPTRPHDFYTVEYHRQILSREYKMYLSGTFLRYYIFLKIRPNRIIGSVNFNIYHDNDTPFAEIGYKIDALHQNQGLAYEACMSAFTVIKKDYGINRVDARIHPDNEASKRLAEKIGFTPIRLEPKCANILGKYEDLIRYSVNISDIQ